MGVMRLAAERISKWTVAVPVAVLLMAGTSVPVLAQDGEVPRFARLDSVAVEGNGRISSEQIASVGGLVLGTEIGFRDIQRAVRALHATGQFDDIRIEQQITDDNRLTLVYVVTERPMLRNWRLEGPTLVNQRDVRDLIKLSSGRPLDRSAMTRAIYSIDSMYRAEGYYASKVTGELEDAGDGGINLLFKVDEGNRVAIAQVEFRGNEAFPDEELVGAIASRPEGFWWYRPGRYDEDRVDEDIRRRLPEWYGDRGYVDFQVVADSMVPDPATGKAKLILQVEEGAIYRVGTIEVVGNSRYSTDEIGMMMGYVAPEQLNSGKEIGTPYNRGQWQQARQRIENQYQNSGYMSSRVVAEQAKRVGPDGDPVLDLRLVVIEGRPSYVNRVNIVGNDVTHERVIREAILIAPGQLFNRDAVISSYQNISNLNFFEQPLPVPDWDPLPNGDIDITFRVTEKRTGNINFGASIGQGTGLGGFLGLEEPNLFGRAKRGRLQWQFGANINDFQLSYSDPAIRESRISGTVSVFNSRQRFVIGDLGRRQQEGASVQFGMPWRGSRFSRVFASYGFQRIRFTEGSADLQSRYRCAPCSRSTVGLTFMRDTRVGLPFPVGGMMSTVSVEQNGGPLGGTGNYRKVDMESKWFTPLGVMGGNGAFGAGVQFTLGISARSGFIFGDPGGFFTELYTLGGVQYGIPLRGYDEFSITPKGFDPNAARSQASVDAFGKAHSAFTVELGARLSQMIYLSSFYDAGNVFGSVRAWDPTRLYRGAGVGAAMISPLGPIGVDLGYGFDKTDLQGKPAPGWHLHLKFGNFF